MNAGIGTAKVTRHPIKDRDQWLAMRMQDVTASDIGAVVGCHPYKTALGLWAEKVGAIPQPDDNPAMRRGRWLEPAVIEAVREENEDWVIWPANEYLRSNELRIGATPDAYMAEGRGKAQSSEDDFRKLKKRAYAGVLQCKTVARPIFEADWEDGPPLFYQLQTLVEAMLGGVEWAVLAVMVMDTFTVELHCYDVPRHPDAETKLIAAVQDFWQSIEKGEEPKADYGRDLKVLKTLRRPDPLAEPVDLSTDNMLPHLLETRAELTKRKGECEKGVAAIDAEVLDKLAGNAAAVAQGWKITNKMQSKKEQIIQASEFPVLRITRKDQ